MATTRAVITARWINQQEQREEPLARVDEPAEHVAAGRHHRRKGPEPARCGAQREHQGSPLLHDGMLYLATPNNAYALDARTGRQVCTTTGRAWAGRRSATAASACGVTCSSIRRISTGVPRRGDRQRTLEPAKADHRGDLYATTAPTVLGNRVLTPAGGDYTDVPGWLESRDPEAERCSGSGMPRRAESRE